MDGENDDDDDDWDETTTNEEKTGTDTTVASTTHNTADTDIMRITDLSEDCLHSLFVSSRALSLEQQLNVSLVCKAWHSVIRSTVCRHKKTLVLAIYNENLEEDDVDVYEDQSINPHPHQRYYSAIPRGYFEQPHHFKYNGLQLFCDSDTHLYLDARRADFLYELFPNLTDITVLSSGGVVVDNNGAFPPQPQQLEVQLRELLTRYRDQLVTFKLHAAKDAAAIPAANNDHRPIMATFFRVATGRLFEVITAMPRLKHLSLEYYNGTHYKAQHVSNNDNNNWLPLFARLDSFTFICPPMPLSFLTNRWIPALEARSNSAEQEPISIVIDVGRNSTLTTTDTTPSIPVTRFIHSPPLAADSAAKVRAMFRGLPAINCDIQGGLQRFTALFTHLTTLRIDDFGATPPWTFMNTIYTTFWFTDLSPLQNTLADLVVKTLVPRPPGNFLVMRGDGGFPDDLEDDGQVEAAIAAIEQQNVALQQQLLGHSQSRRPPRFVALKKFTLLIYGAMNGDDEEEEVDDENANDNGNNGNGNGNNNDNNGNNTRGRSYAHDYLARWVVNARNATDLSMICPNLKTLHVRLINFNAGCRDCGGEGNGNDNDDSDDSSSDDDDDDAQMEIVDYDEDEDNDNNNGDGDKKNNDNKSMHSFAKKVKRCLDYQVMATVSSLVHKRAESKNTALDTVIIDWKSLHADVAGGNSSSNNNDDNDDHHQQENEGDQYQQQLKITCTVSIKDKVNNESSSAADHHGNDDDGNNNE